MTLSTLQDNMEYRLEDQSNRAEEGTCCSKQPSTAAHDPHHSKQPRSEQAAAPSSHHQMGFPISCHMPGRTRSLFADSGSVSHTDTVDGCSDAVENAVETGFEWLIHMGDSIEESTNTVSTTTTTATDTFSCGLGY
mmetsp:Transcript_32417/g.68174  ORF Transcript_32417/g.68174 Transcript_32417/m.68174 type:complete len:136 (+) Transcript_32417:433-840(+)